MKEIILSDKEKSLIENAYTILAEVYDKMLDSDIEMLEGDRVGTISASEVDEMLCSLWYFIANESHQF